MHARTIIMLSYAQLNVIGYVSACVCVCVFGSVCVCLCLGALVLLSNVKQKCVLSI